MKKDYDYIAAVEKAIVEKYGKDAVQDFRSTWSPDKEREYLQDLKQRNDIKNKNNLELQIAFSGSKNNRTCPVCKTYSFSNKDDLYMNRFKCCYECYIDFVDDREERWEQGWRPDNKRLEAALQRRKKQWPI